MGAHCQKNSMIEKTVKQNRSNFPLYIVALVYNFYYIFDTFFKQSSMMYILFSDNTENLLVCPWTLRGTVSQHFQENWWAKGCVHFADGHCQISFQKCTVPIYNRTNSV